MTDPNLARHGIAQVPGRGRCTSFAPGHAMHHIQASLVSGSPVWRDEAVVRDGDAAGESRRTDDATAGRTEVRWRDAAVTEVGDDGWLGLDFVAGGSTRVWHHAPLGLAVGDPVSLSDHHYVLATGQGWFNVYEEGLGEPIQPCRVPERMGGDDSAQPA